MTHAAPRVRRAGREYLVNVGLLVRLISCHHGASARQSCATAVRPFFNAQRSDEERWDLGTNVSTLHRTLHCCRVTLPASSLDSMCILTSTLAECHSFHACMQLKCSTK